MFHHSYKEVDGLKFYPNIPKNKSIFTGTKSNKKYKVVYKGKYIYFGDKRYQQYKDKIGYFGKYDHGDTKRRDTYRARHKNILNKDGKPSYKIKGTPAYYSWHYLWS